MAFFNNDGKNVSFECSELIEELKEDISSLGGDQFVDVIAETYEGVTIYKDYYMHDAATQLPDLEPGEFWQQMTASDLLALYELENSII